MTRSSATMIGIEAIRGLHSCGQRIRLAVAGAAAVSLALTLGDAPTCQTFIVSSGSGRGQSGFGVGALRGPRALAIARVSDEHESLSTSAQFQVVAAVSKFGVCFD